ncbi:GNAT family N-acetyltransferase [Alteriqipengyuania sp.]|uniref:GNAT family N-acetyltransferase n=1 Tax=Alteriqipengyuania sp. TaxID=2800692 RepID=UPI0035121339
MNALSPIAAKANTLSQIDALAEADDPRRSFLRGKWFTADARESETVLLSDEDAQAIAAFPLVERRLGPLSVREIAGCYWPYCSVPIAADASVDSLAAAMEAQRGRLGRIWRLGPVEADDPALATLLPAAREAGWTVLARQLGTVFELDLAPAANGKWPSSKTQRKNRWRKRRLEERHGKLRVEFFTGLDWTASHRDAMAAIEEASWLGKLDDGGDTKFSDQTMRAYWEGLCSDPRLAAKLFGSILWLGETPAAFTFGVEAGDTRYYIANNFDDRFTKFGPGRVLLYDDFAHAAADGITRVSWGVGDAGYKTEMGAEPASSLLDLLFVRGGVAAKLLGLRWKDER